MSFEGAKTKAEPNTKVVEERPGLGRDVESTAGTGDESPCFLPRRPKVTIQGELLDSSSFNTGFPRTVTVQRYWYWMHLNGVQLSLVCSDDVMVSSSWASGYSLCSWTRSSAQ